jgi:hypothetical protein
MKLLQNLRSLLGIGLIWGILWAALAIIVGTIIGVIDPDDIGPGEEPIVLAPRIGLVGFICGVAFGALVSTAERGKPITDLPLTRVAMWGILVAAALPLVIGMAIPEMLVTVPLGAVSAMASVAIVRKVRRPRPAPPAGRRAGRRS